MVGQWPLCTISLKKESAAICLPVRLLLGHHIIKGQDAIDDVDDDDNGGDDGGDDCGDDDGDESVFQ